MAGTTVYAPNGATFNCDTPERLEHYLKAGWSKRPIKKAKTEPTNAEPTNAEPDKSTANKEE